MLCVQGTLVEIEPEDSHWALRRPRQARKGSPKFRDPVDFEIFPEALGERIPQDHEVRRLLRALGQADLGPILRSYEHKGGTPYHPLNLLAVVLYGMMDGVRSSRSLQEHCVYDARYRFLMGGHEPDDRTFGRFMTRLDGLIDALFKNVMLTLRGTRHRSAGSEVLVDGGKKAANASWWKYTEDSDETPSDPEARLQNSHGRKLVGYNVQVAMDSRDNSIVATEVLSDQNDQHAAPVLMETMLFQHGSYPVAVLADKGYDCGEAIGALESKGIDTVISIEGWLPEELSENGDGVLVCPLGKPLVKTGQRNNGKGTTYDVYRPEGGCKGCPLAGQCGFKGKRLHVKEGSDPGCRIRNQARLASAQYAGAMGRRRNVERLFARMVATGFTRFLRRGRNKARTELICWAISYNIQTLVWLFVQLAQLFWGHHRALSRLECCRFSPQQQLTLLTSA